MGNMKGFACVTGADRGLGFELTRQLLRRGYHVFAGSYLSKWNNLQELKKEHPDFLDIVELDVSSDDSVEAAGRYIHSKTGAIDILINNAGIAGKSEGVYEKLDFEDMLRVYNVNALGALRVVSALIRLITSGKQRIIVNISSEAGSIGTCWRDNEFSYCMSKAALNMQSALVHNATRSKGVKIIQVHPGGMKSCIWNRPYQDAPVVEVAQTDHYLTAEKSAEYIAQLLDDPERFFGDKPCFVNYRGDKIAW